MLPRAKRLTRAEFLSTKQKKKLFHASLLLLSVTYADATKAAVVVSKKVAGSAVERNTLRRRIYAALGELLEQTTRDAYIVVIAKKGLEDASFEELKQQLGDLLVEAKIRS